MYIYIYNSSIYIYTECISYTYNFTCCTQRTLRLRPSCFVGWTHWRSANKCCMRFLKSCWSQGLPHGCCECQCLRCPTMGALSSLHLAAPCQHLPALYTLLAWMPSSDFQSKLLRTLFGPIPGPLSWRPILGSSSLFHLVTQPWLLGWCQCDIFPLVSIMDLAQPRPKLSPAAFSNSSARRRSSPPKLTQRLVPSPDSWSCDVQTGLLTTFNANKGMTDRGSSCFTEASRNPMCNYKSSTAIHPRRSNSQVSNSIRSALP